MRANVLAGLVVLATIPLALATPASPPWEFDGSRVEGSGAVGERIEVTVRVKANADLDATIVLRAPAWVLVEGGPWRAVAPAGGTVERAWTLTPTDEGFWVAIASSDPPGLGGACACAMGFATGAPEAVVGAHADEAVPVPVLDRTLTASPQQDGFVLVERAVVPVSSWLARAELRAWVTKGSTYRCASCAVAAPDPAHEARGRGSEALVLRASLPLAEGEAYTLWDSVTVRFDAPADSALHPEVTLGTGCENRRWGTDETWSCETPSREWAHLTRRAPLPLPPLAPLAAFALAGALGRARPS